MARVYLGILLAALMAAATGCGDVPAEELDGELQNPASQTMQGQYCNSCVANCELAPGGRAVDVDLGHAMTPSQCADAAEKKCGDSLVRWHCAL